MKIVLVCYDICHKSLRKWYIARIADKYIEFSYYLDYNGSK